MSALILGGLALYALTRPRVSHAALVGLGTVTDTEYLTLTPSAVLPAVEIIGVEVIEDPVPGVYAKVWVTIKQNAGAIISAFVRIYDDDTGAIVGYKKNYLSFGPGDTGIAKYDWLDDWSITMPNRVWNLRIEAGTN